MYRKKTCNNCGLLNHISKVCGLSKTKESEISEPRERSANTEPHLKDTVNFLQSLSILYESGYSSGDDNMVATVPNDLEKIEYAY